MSLELTQQVMIQESSYTKDSSLVILKADRAPTLSHYFSTTDTGPQQQVWTAAASNYLALHAWQQKSADMCNIVVGAGPCPSDLVDPAQTMYLDGRTAMGAAVAQPVEQMYHDLMMTAHVTEPPPTMSWLDGVVWVVDSIGSSIRQGIQFLLWRGQSQQKTIHVLSNQPNLAVWLSQVLPASSWSIVWYHARDNNDVDQFRAHANHTSLALISCCDDMVTMAFAMTASWGMSCASWIQLTRKLPSRRLVLVVCPP